MKERLNKFTKEAAEIEIHLGKTKETIAAADSLVIGLEGEYERWNKEVSCGGSVSGLWNLFQALFSVLGFGSGIWSGFLAMSSESGFWLWGSVSQVPGSRFWVPISRIWFPDFRFQVISSGFRVSGTRFQVLV